MERPSEPLTLEERCDRLTLRETERVLRFLTGYAPDELEVALDKYGSGAP